MKLEEFDRAKEAVFNPVDIVQKPDGTAGGPGPFQEPVCQPVFLQLGQSGKYHGY